MVREFSAVRFIMPETNQRPYDVEKVITTTVRKTLMELGLDTSDPIELQKDFAHLRAWRESTEDIKRKGTLTVIGIIISGLAGLIWIALKPVLH